MGIIKGCFKVIGTAALVVTGTASTVLKGCSDAVGLELGSELFGATKDASFNGIRRIWDNDTCDEIVSEGEEKAGQVEDTFHCQMASTAYRAAQLAKEKGDMEKYDQYMDKYYQYK